MLGQNQRQTDDEQPTTNSRRSVLSSIGAGLGALGLGAVGGVGTVEATGLPELRTNEDDWQIVFTGSDDGVAAESHISGSDEDIFFDHRAVEDWGNLSYISTQYFSRLTNSESGKVVFDWEYNGYFEADNVEVRIEFGDEETTLVDEGVNYSSLSGKEEVTVDNIRNVTVSVFANGVREDDARGTLTLIPRESKPLEEEEEEEEELSFIELLLRLLFGI